MMDKRELDGTIEKFSVEQQIPEFNATVDIV